MGNSPLRDVLGRFATGVTVISAGRGTPTGMTANSFTSVSLDPPLVLVCVNRRSAIHQAVMDNGSFTVSVLSAGQEHVARYFADHGRPRGEDEFADIGWWPAPRTGTPVLNGALSWLECELASAHEGGDHSIFVGSVIASGNGPDSGALLFFGGGFHRPDLSRKLAASLSREAS
jgi:flavin reductase (DIM6/NTAB) family NADH-FMN oxidoreductase RutF